MMMNCQIASLCRLYTNTNQGLLCPMVDCNLLVFYTDKPMGKQLSHVCGTLAWEFLLLAGINSARTMLWAISSHVTQ